jgi:predicted Zn-dependent peptidase
VFERTALPSGPRVISARLPGARSVSIAAYVLAGSRLETPEQAGVAHFMEHITFKGTKRFPSTRAISEAIETTHINGWTSPDLPRTTFSRTQLMNPAPIPTVMS